MKAMILHTPSVPCVTKIERAGETPYKGSNVLYLNPEAIVRYDPEGAVITPPLFQSTFIFVDMELARLIHQKSFDARNLTQETADLLISSDILLKNKPINGNYCENRVEVIGLPVHAVLDVTSTCNCDCVICYHKTDLGNYTPPLNDVLKRIDKLKELGLGLFEITGGEPLLRNDLKKILDYLSQLRLHFYIVTNGEYLKDMDNGLINALKGGLGVAVSLDGIGEIHDRIRRRKGLYSAILLGLDLLLKNGVNFYFVSTLNNENVDCIPGMVSLAERYNTTVQLRPVLRTGAAVVNNVGQPESIGKFKDYLSHPNVWNNFLATKKSIPEAKYYGCSIRKMISIDSRGILFPCAFDRNRQSQPIEKYDKLSLVNELKREIATFAEKHNLCSKCELRKGLNFNCNAFCRFSLSYTKGK